MSKIPKEWGYAMAIPSQGIALFLFAYYSSEWLNEHYPRSFNWFLITFFFAVVGMGHMVYLIVRKQDRDSRAKETPLKGTPPKGTPPKGTTEKVDNKNIKKL